MQKNYPILTEGMTPTPGELYTLIEHFAGDVEIVSDPYVVESRVDEATGRVELIEKSEKPGAKMVIRGVFQAEGMRNANKRVYPLGLWERHLRPESSLTKRIADRRCTGATEHPESGVSGLKEASILVTKLSLGEMREDKSRLVIGEAEVLSGAEGQVIRALIRDGVKFGISSRGIGTINAEGVVDEKTFVPKTWDIVGDPSTPGAFPTVSDDAVVSENVNRVRLFRNADKSISWTIVEEDQSVNTPETILTEGKTNMAKTKETLRELMKTIRPLLGESLDGKSSDALAEIDETLADAQDSISELRKADDTLTESTSVDLDRIAARREQIAEQQVALSTGDPAHSGIGDGSDDDDDVSEEVQRLNGLLERSATAIKTLQSQIEERDRTIDDQEQALNDMQEEVEAIESERDDLYETVAMQSATLQSLTADCIGGDGVDLEESVNDLIEENENLEKYRSILERCETAEELDSIVEGLGVTKAPGANAWHNQTLPPVASPLNESNTGVTSTPRQAAPGTMSEGAAAANRILVAMSGTQNPTPIKAVNS